MTPENKYNKSQIYIIRSKNSDNFYIGSTIQGVDLRLYKHYVDYKGYTGITPAYRNYRSSFKIIEDGDTFIECLETYNCENKKELLRREKQYIMFARDKYKEKCVNKYYPLSKEIDPDPEINF